MKKYFCYMCNAHVVHFLYKVTPRTSEYDITVYMTYLFTK